MKLRNVQALKIGILNAVQYFCHQTYVFSEKVKKNLSDQSQQR